MLSVMSAPTNFGSDTRTCTGPVTNAYAVPALGMFPFDDAPI